MQSGKNYFGRIYFKEISYFDLFVFFVSKDIVIKLLSENVK